MAECWNDNGVIDCRRKIANARKRRRDDIVDRSLRDITAVNVRIRAGREYICASLFVVLKEVRLPVYEKVDTDVACNSHTWKPVHTHTHKEKKSGSEFEFDLASTRFTKK